jgi:hypothetical protein
MYTLANQSFACELLGLKLFKLETSDPWLNEIAKNGTLAKRLDAMRG